MMTLVLTILAAVLGIAGTWLKFRLDPKQQVYVQLDLLAKQKIILERQRDEALAKNDIPGVTIAGNALFQLREQQNTLLQRLRDINSGK